MDYFNIKKYSDNLYQFQDKLGVLATLVIGSNKTLLFDTCYGIGRLDEEVKKITNKELIVVASHGHMDHTAGNYQFPFVYIHKNDIDLCKAHNGMKRREQNLEALGDREPDLFNRDEYLKQREGKLLELNMPCIFDLGGITLEVIEAFGHTQGSIALYSKELKLMLVSDATCPWVWLFLKESTPVSTYIKSVEHLLTYDFDNFLVGHGMRMLPRYRMEEFLQTAKEIDLSKSVKVTFNNFDDCNSYCYSKYKMYDQDKSGIVFDPTKL